MPRIPRVWRGFCPRNRAENSHMEIREFRGFSMFKGALPPVNRYTLRMTLITYRGRTQSISAWSRELGFSTGTLHSRLGKLGQTVEQAFTAPVDRSKSPAARPKVVRKIKGPPKLEAHHSGRARVRWYEGGRRREVFLGLFGAEATANAYARFCAE